MIESAISSACVTCGQELLCQICGGPALNATRSQTSTPLTPARMLMLLVQKVDNIDMYT